MSDFHTKIESLKAKMNENILANVTLFGCLCEAFPEKKEKFIEIMKKNEIDLEKLEE